MLPAALPSAPVASVLSGGSKRRARNALPKMFLVARKRPREIEGAVLVVECLTTASNDSFVVLAGHCMLREPLEADSITHGNGLYMAKGDLEMRARTAPSFEGSSLNDHFSACAGVLWRCWPLPDSDLETLLEASRCGK